MKKITIMLGISLLTLVFALPQCFADNSGSHLLYPCKAKRTVERVKQDYFTGSLSVEELQPELIKIMTENMKAEFNYDNFADKWPYKDDLKTELDKILREKREYKGKATNPSVKNSIAFKSKSAMYEKMLREKKIELLYAKLGNPNIDKQEAGNIKRIIGALKKPGISKKAAIIAKDWILEKRYAQFGENMQKADMTNLPNRWTWSKR